MDAVFLDEYERVDCALEQLGVRGKALPPEARGRPRPTAGNNRGAVDAPEILTPSSEEKAAKGGKGVEGKSLEYLFAKILAGPLSPSVTDGASASVNSPDSHGKGTPTRSQRDGELHDIDDPDHVVDISESFSDRSVSTPPRTPNRANVRRIVKTPPSSGRKRNRNRVLSPLSRSPKPKRIFNPVSPIPKVKGETDTLLFNSIEF